MSLNVNLPYFFSHEERAAALVLIERSKTSVLPYSGSWTANWLLSDIHDSTWMLRTPKTRKVGMEWKRALTLDWGAKLADGTTLTDNCNKNMLLVAQKLGFLIRRIPSLGIDASLSQAMWIGNMLTIIQWLYLHSDLYNPRKFLFNRVNAEAITDFMIDYVKGGKTSALQLPQRCLQLFYRRALGSEPNEILLSNPYKVPDNVRNIIINQLNKECFYKHSTCRNRGSTYRHIDRMKIKELLDAGEQDIKSIKIAAFLRQFEPDLLSINKDLLIPTESIRTEYHSHRTLMLDEAILPITFEKASNSLFVWQQILRLSRHLSYAIPSTSNICLQKARHIVKYESTLNKHTPWVPLKTALAYTTESLRWIAVYGEPLIDFYILAIREFTANGIFNNQCVTKKRKQSFRHARDAWTNNNLPESLRALGIKNWNSVYTAQSKKGYFHQMRLAPSVNDALRILIGAIIVLIASTKPVRSDELSMLRRNCLTFVEGDGYWLEQLLRKANISDNLAETAKPIPYITAKAIQLLCRLGEASASIHQSLDQYAQNALFYIPYFGKNGMLSPRLITKREMETCIDRFCDYAALPADKLGRRWYLRVHELRKSFLITFFWCYKYSSLEAARWIAGHNSPEQVYAYIQANFPGEELPQIEAQYAARQLWDFSMSRDLGETGDIEVFYHSVCRHFGVTEINVIDKIELQDWLELAFAKGIYQIYPYRIESKDGLIGTEVAFKIKGVAIDA